MTGNNNFSIFCKNFFITSKYNFSAITGLNLSWDIIGWNLSIAANHFPAILLGMARYMSSQIQLVRSHEILWDLMGLGYYTLKKSSQSINFILQLQLKSIIESFWVFLLRLGMHLNEFPIY